MIKAIRVSKTSLKHWALFGPVEGALKTTCQAEVIKPINLHLGDVGGAVVDLELWINVEAGEPGQDEPNPPAQQILQEAEARKSGLTAEEALLSGQALPQLPIVKGVGVLTGPGGSDMPEDNLADILARLLGQQSFTEE